MFFRWFVVLLAIVSCAHARFPHAYPAATDQEALDGDSPAFSEVNTTVSADARPVKKRGAHRYRRQLQAPGWSACTELAQIGYLTHMFGTDEDGVIVAEAYDMFCRSDHSQTGASVDYSNGTRATSSWATAGASWYYPNGRTITSSAGQQGATWYYPNGETLTSSAGQRGATYYYPGGRTITSYAGQRGATWYYVNGQTMTSWAGQAGATWYYENGNTWTSDGQLIDEVDLMRIACIVADAHVQKLPNGRCL